MPEIIYKELNKYLDQSSKFYPVCLIYGEEMLYKSALNSILDFLLPGEQKKFNYEPIDGANENIYDAVQRVNTYSLMPGTKVVGITDSKIFYSKQDHGIILEKAKKACDENNIKKGARLILNLLGLLHLGYEDISRQNRKKALKIEAQFGNDVKWFDDIIKYCITGGLAIPEAKDTGNALQQAVEKGFPEGNHLIITTDMVDKRRLLFKTIKKKGIIIDCSVPKGERRVDKTAQEGVLREKAKEILAEGGKKIDGAAFRAMSEMTGFDLRTFCNNLQKLVVYIGNREKITTDDVNQVLKRTKKDPIYEFTNAVTDRNTENAVFYLNSLLAGGEISHPLQLLAAMTNQIRKLLIVKDFIENSNGTIWNRSVQYNDFKNKIIPLIKEHDQALLNRFAEWEKNFSPEEDDDPSEKKKKKKPAKAKISSDLVIAKNPGNPYPVYQIFRKSDNFTKDELLADLVFINKSDLRMKSGENPKLVLEDTVFFVCINKSISR